METIIVKSNGINWINYQFVCLDSSSNTAHLGYSWRAHKYEDRGLHVSAHPDAIVYARSHDISQWQEDGRPGGFDGCKNNYRRPPYAVVDGVRYDVV